MVQDKYFYLYYTRNADKEYNFIIYKWENYIKYHRWKIRLVLGVMDFKRLTMATLCSRLFKLSSYFHHPTTFANPCENQDKNLHHFSAFHGNHL